MQGEERKVGRRPGAAGIARRRGLVWAAGGRRKEREGERLTGGPRSSAPREKKKRRRGEEWAGAGGLMGRLAIWAEREPALVFFFFLFLFQTSFSNQNSFQIQIKLFKLFLKNFINFLETTQATKNHASQLMMHNHLLSLGL
jgi:hypothetical protein